MNDRKPFIAVCWTATDYSSYYGVVKISHGEYLEMKELGSLVEVARRKFRQVNAISAADSYTIWYEAIPWAQGRAEDELTQQDEVERLVLDGDWVKVHEADLDDESTPAIRTACDEVEISTESMQFSFYEKHGDTRIGSPYLNMKQLDEHFGG